ncbi:MAG: 3-hydroxyacyl-CoA dehydrogenase family protein [Candidatus Heimdallarchaeota archaeon]|nr:MAG: 3-hydroxyacyl-CoA dehydrogenase family protein [Candidatus Heimdallarchaeota archaeon]
MRKVNNIVVVGVGQMGKGIAQVCLMAGYNVTLMDIQEDIIKNAVNYIKNGLNKLESKGQLLGGLTTTGILKNLNTTTNLIDAVNDADYIIEAIIEKLDIKQKVCKGALDNSPDHCIFASNTSSIRITDIAKTSKKPANVIGMHFFNPAPLMRLIEIIAGEKSSKEAIDIGVEVGESLPCLRGERYVPQVLKDRPGFIVNRVLAPGRIYSDYIYDLAYKKGIPWEQVDADVSNPKAPMSQLVVADFVGRDVSLHTAEYYAETLSSDFAPGEFVRKQVAEGNLGQKTGRGFYDWSKGRPKPDLSKKAGIVNPMVYTAIQANEGCRILEEGVCQSWKVIDEAILAGMNFPGPMKSATENYKQMVELLEEYSEKLKKSYIKPVELLRSGEFVDMV